MMDNPKIAEIVEKLRRRDERYEAIKKSRRVSFADLGVNKEDEQEEICIFRALKIRNRIADWPVEQKKKPDLYATIVDSIKNHKIDDILIVFGKINFKCPKILLSCFTNIFNIRTNDEFVDLTIYGIKSKCFCLLYRWMLTEAIDGQPGLKEINAKNVLELLNASKKLRIAHLEDQCWYFLQKTAQCEESIAFELYKSLDYNLKDIQQLMLSKICKYFLTLVSTEDFLKFNVDEVCTLLSLNTLGVNSEIEVFYAAILWLNHMWNERKGGKTLVDVMKCVRFNFMPSWFLISLNERTGTDQVDKVTEHTFVGNLITDAIIFSATQLSYLTGKYDIGSKKLKQVEQSIPSQRRWVYDNTCSYHFRPDSNTMEYVTFEMFTYYLKRLREFGKEYWRTLEYANSDHCKRIWKSRPNLKQK